MRTLLLGCVLALAPAVVSAAASTPPPEVVQHAVTVLKPMVGRDGCRPAERPGWPSGMVMRCVYVARDRVGDRRTFRTAVWLADPTPARAAAWAWAACLKAQPETPAPCAKAALDRMKLIASAAHFPVAGVYYEDIDPKDGREEAYFFRDGATTRLEGFELLNGTRWPAEGEDGVRLADQVAAAAVKSMRTGMARPVAVTPGEYLEASGDRAVPASTGTPEAALAWAAIVRNLTIVALTGPEEGSHNPLVTAWVCTNLQRAVSARICFDR